MKHIVVRMVAAYFPHTRYSVDDYTVGFDVIRKIMINGVEVTREGTRGMVLVAVVVATKGRGKTKTTRSWQSLHL